MSTPSAMWAFVRWAPWRSPSQEAHPFMGFNCQHIFRELQSLILSFHRCHLIRSLWYSQLRTRLKLFSLVYGREGLGRGNSLPGVTQLTRWERRGEPRSLDSQLKVTSSFVLYVLAPPRVLGHPPAVASSPPDLAETSEGCLDSQSSAVNIGEGFSYLRVTSHSSSCQQPKHPSTCRL